MNVAFKTPRTLTFKTLARAALGLRLSPSTSRSNPKDKGAVGKRVEALVRKSLSSQGYACAGLTQSAPDFGAFELKVIQVKRTSEGGYRVKEDMAISMLSPASLSASLPQSPLAKKLNIAIALVEQRSSCAVVVGVVHLPLLQDPRVHADYKGLRQAYRSKLKTYKGCGASALSALGADTQGYGVVMKSKTKGPGKCLPHQRTRAWYVRAGYLTQVVNAACA